MVWRTGSRCTDFGSTSCAPSSSWSDEQRVGLLQRQHELVRRERKVLGRLTVAVDNSRDLLVATEPTCGSLAELDATLGGDDDL